VALLFGNERTGLQNQHLRVVHATALIPTGPQKTSLNLSHAVGIALHEQHAALEALEVREAQQAPEVRGRHPSEGSAGRGGSYSSSSAAIMDNSGGGGGGGEEGSGGARESSKGTAPRGRVAGESQRRRLVEELLEALDAVELRPPSARPPAGLEASELWGTRRATDRKALERLVGGGSSGGWGSGDRVGGGEGAPVYGADVEVLSRLARRVSAGRIGDRAH